MIVLALDLDALRPDFVGILNVYQDAGIIGFGRDFDKTPDNGQKIIAINVRGPEVADRGAGAMDDAVGDAPSLQRVGMVFHAKGPTGKIFAVEKSDFAGSRMSRQGRGGIVL